MKEIGEAIVSLSAGEATSLFVYLKPLEEGLDPPARSALAKLERFLYDVLSIDELESLNERAVI